jgi:MerR family transcriptional regulator, light-induced transcriptional regulator
MSVESSSVEGGGAAPDRPRAREGAPSALIRIGELSRRTGVSADALRAWERRYALLDPVRTGGGFRLYSEADEARVRAMRALIRDGVSAAEAARSARRHPPSAPPSQPAAASPSVTAWQLQTALEGFDEGRAHAVLDQVLAALSFDAVARGVILPTLRSIGDRWESGDVTVAQEHFATNLIRGRLLGLARGWGAGEGRRALLACAPGEQHDIGLIVFGVALNRRGWRITYLGPDTPSETISSTAREVGARLVVIAALDPVRLERAADMIRDLSATLRLLLAGGGATEEQASALGARHLPGGPIEAASDLANHQPAE